MSRRIYSLLRRFRRETEGSVTVEILWWVPVIILAVNVIVDASMMFQGQAVATRVLQDANRKMSTGALGSLIVQTDPTLEAARLAKLKTNAEAFIKSRLAFTSPKATVNATVTASMVTTTVAMPASDLAVVNWISVLRRSSVNASSRLYLER